MDKASGVYYYLIDNSVSASGSSGLVGLVAMLTTKGTVGSLNKVTASDFKDILGYDLTYNPNYLGLLHMLQTVSYLYVMRINNGALCANAYFATLADTVKTLATCTDVAQIAALSPALYIAHTNPGKWGSYMVKLTPTLQEQTITNVAGTYTLSSAVTSTVADSTVYIYTADGNTLLASGKDDDTGTIQVKLASDSTTVVGTISKGTTSFVTTAVIGTGTNLLVKWISNDYTEWTLSYYSGTSSSDASLVNTYSFSTLTTSDIYYADVDFGDLTIGFTTLTSAVSRDYIPLASGSNGSTPTASSIDFSILKKSTANVVVMNGITDISVVNAFLKVCATTYKSCLCDVPDYTTYASAADWRKSLYSTEYGQLFWIPDTESTDVGDVFIYPSVNAFLIYANMYASQGNGRYPPAGYKYGNISVTSLLETDYAQYPDELKTARINYQKVGSKGPAMWEQRTLYSLDSDLSYASTVFILRDLREQLIEFMENYNFTYTTPTELIAIEAGLKGIINDYLSNNYLVSGSVVVPSYADAQKSGRTLNINIAVAVISDAEVINLKVVVNKA